ncbi:Gfo/Idh/MocA family protein [Demequina sp. NBRC 110056]|uniref:Gfo/Idh/MocA family oxidoreductase n=1 Tax=Demequina sp. NBRC 110056 TaxID=1570345 RepID=UPI0009FFF5A8|nr:Gfo/Idh/MocA family oxidoreductase [Demequina sp. NBRC 110056]
MRIGIVGTGSISRALGADVALVDGVTVSAVASRSSSRARALAATLKAPSFYDRVDDLLADTAVDLVYVATPTSTHSDIAVRTLRAGKHVLVEKPLAAHPVEAARIAHAQSESGLFAMEAMWMKFADGYRAAMAFVQGERLGTPRSLRAAFGIPAGAARPLPGTTLDQGIYAIAMAHDLFGEPAGVHAVGTVLDGVDATVFAQLEFQDGVVAQIASSHREYIAPSAAISGTKGWLEIPAPFWTPLALRIHSGTDPLSALFGPETLSYPVQGNGYVPMISAVAEAIGKGATEHPLHTLRDATASLLTATRIREALLPVRVAPRDVPVRPPAATHGRTA